MDQGTSTMLSPDIKDHAELTSGVHQSGATTACAGNQQGHLHASKPLQSHPCWSSTPAQPYTPVCCSPQEAAVGIGYGAAALPLWEEFVIRFFKYETQLGAVVPKQQIANHLQQLALLYETSGPVLSDIYALLSCLSPDQLPGVSTLPHAYPVPSPPTLSPHLHWLNRAAALRIRQAAR